MKKRILSLCVLLISISGANAQEPADRDDTFNVSGIGTFISGTGPQISKVTPLPDGKVLVTGPFYSFGDPSYSGLMRLNADGSYDDTFLSEGTFGSVAATAIQADGKIIIGGGFTTYNGISIQGIARIHADGTLDDTFDPGSGFSSILPPPWVKSIAIQPDGRIIVGGAFTTYNGTTIWGVCRLHTDGSLDDTFSPGSGPNNIVEAVALQDDGKIVAGGVFSTFNGISTGKLVRLHADGSLDETFSTQTSGDISRVIIQPDGKILTAGERFYRLENDGSLESGFPAALVGNPFAGLALQNDGKIVLTGFFTSYQGLTRQRIVRLNTDGTVDESFDSEIGFSTNPNHIALQADGKILVYGGLSYKGEEGMITRIHGTSTGVGTEEHTEPTVSIYPNPASRQVTVDIAGTRLHNGHAMITLIDTQGRRVLTQTAKGPVTRLPVDHLPAGLYILRVDAQEMHLVKSLVIE